MLIIALTGSLYELKENHTRHSYRWCELAPVDVVQPSDCNPALVQVLGELLCGRAEDMPDVIKRESSRLPTGLNIGMVQVSGVFPDPLRRQQRPLLCGHCLTEAAACVKCL